MDKQQKARAASIRKKLNLRWGYKESSHKYQMAASVESCDTITNHLKDELFDGILLNLSVRNNNKSLHTQMRIVRRIVEKRQAQANHRKNGRTEDLFAQYLSISCTSLCMESLRKHRLAV